MKFRLYRGKNKKTNNLVYGFLSVNDNYELVIVQEERLDVGDKKHLIYVEYIVDEDSVSEFTGFKDKSGNQIFTNDLVKYKNSIYMIKFFPEYGAYGMYDEKHERPLGRSGSSTKYEPYFMSTYHTRLMEIQ